MGGAPLENRFAWLVALASCVGSQSKQIAEAKTVRKMIHAYQEELK